MKRAAPALDPRWFQILFQTLFLAYGIFALHWPADWLHYAISIGGCLLFTVLAESLRQRKLAGLRNAQLRSAAFSVLISAASLCLLLKTNYWWVSGLAAALTVASKYLLRIRSKHLFNPSAFGIVATILLTGEAWLSPGQWGSHAVLFFSIITLGTIVVTRVQKLDVSLAFLITFGGLLYWRQVLVLGWPMDHFIHSLATGSLLLFTFFMISDPRTAPNHSGARMLWAVLIGAVAFYLAAFKFMNSTPVWVLVAAAPLVPLFDWLFKAPVFRWQPAAVPFTGPAAQHPAVSRITALLLLLMMAGNELAAFCGFYVAKADGTLTNKTSQIIMVRDGEQTSITMYNDFKGDTKDFAMVVPVPVVLKKDDIHVLDAGIFQKLNDYSKPRLVEYHDQNPCQRILYDDVADLNVRRLEYRSAAPAALMLKKEKVTIEAQYLVGEYDILILSATESGALRSWLTNNGYKIPRNADEVLEPYIKSNLKFFVVKVNEEERRKLASNFLRPLQINFNSPKFMLPIRLGMANADGDQDLLVYAFTRKGRVELTNYRTLPMPTGDKIPVAVRENFGAFYSNLFRKQWIDEGESVGFLEYAWDVSPVNSFKCDPCVAEAPSQQDLVQAGVWWVKDGQQNGNGDNRVYFTRLHLRYNRASFPQDLQFQLTPNTQNYQARYVITHAAQGDFSCDAGKAYQQQLIQRRREELANLRKLTGTDLADWDVVK